MQILLLSLVLALCASSATADQLVGPPAPREQVGNVPGFSDEGLIKPRREKFFGPVNLLTGLALAGAAIYDVKTTVDAYNLQGNYEIHRPDGSVSFVTVVVYEKSAFYRAAVNSNDVGSLWRRKAYVNAPIWVGSHFLRRSRHLPLKVVGWAAPVVLGGLQLKAGLDNRKEYNRINALLR